MEWGILRKSSKNTGVTKEERGMMEQELLSKVSSGRAGQGREHEGNYKIPLKSPYGNAYCRSFLKYIQ